MPILEDLRDHELFGPAIRQGREEGVEKGERKALVIVIEQRLGCPTVEGLLD
jgi:hypothetical protein